MFDLSRLIEMWNACLFRFNDRPVTGVVYNIRPIKQYSVVPQIFDSVRPGSHSKVSGYGIVQFEYKNVLLNFRVGTKNLFDLYPNI